MTIVNTETVPGRTIIDVKGLVQGSTVRAKDVGRDIAAGTSGGTEWHIVGHERDRPDPLTEVRRCLEALRAMGAV